MATKVIDKGYNRIRQQMALMEDARVNVGILAGETYPDDPSITVPEIAVVHEFGSTKRNIPERSFLRSTADDKRIKYRRILRDGMISIMEGTATTKGVLDNFGKIVVGDVQRKITAIKTPPNMPATIKAKKGKSNPLIDEGTLRSRIKSEVEL